MPKPKRERVKKVLDVRENRLGRMLKHRYGIAKEQYDSMYRQQNGRCAICNVEKDLGGYSGLYVDHCHKTQKVRGLLCSNCNSGIGQFMEDESVLMAAIEYLRRNDIP